MYAISLGDDGAELRPLEPWHAEEFLAHLDRGREFIASPRPLRIEVHGPRLRARPAPAVRRQARRRHRVAARDLAGREARRRGAVPRTSTRSRATARWAAGWNRRRRARSGHARDAGPDRLGDRVRGIHRVEWHASSVQRREHATWPGGCGMSRTACCGRSYPHRGVRHDTEVWSVLAPEWRAARARAAHRDH